MVQGEEQWQKVTAEFAAENKELMGKVLQALRGTLGPQ